MAQQLEHLKWINGTNFMVDGFNFQNARCKNYFLTHFHSDHTTGLNRGFSSGIIYCSPITATLLKKDMGLPAERVIPLSVDTAHIIDGVTVTLMDANHCPGACMMLFKVATKHGKPQVILHTGDMRWQPRLAEHSALKACKVELLYMDTTYCLPKHVFPSQDNAIASLVKVMRDAHAEERKTLFVVGSYHIGKERAFFGAARALGFKIWCHAAKKQVMQWCEMPKADMDRLVTKESAAQIHVVFMGQGLQPEALEQRRLKGNYAKIVAFRPTGWSYQKKGLQTRREGNVTIYGIPYSEHSSFAELRDCVKRLRPKRIIPTVNCPDAASARAIVDRFADLMDLSRDKSRLDSYFGRTASAPAVTMAAADQSVYSQLTAEDTRSHVKAQASGLRTDKQEPAVGSSASAGEDYGGQLLDSLDWQDQNAEGWGLTIDTVSPEQIKWEEQEEACAGTAAWEGAPSPYSTSLQSGVHEHSYRAEEDQHDEQILPMREQAVPEHAHSAPAVLSPLSKLTHPRPDPDDPQCASAGYGSAQQDCPMLANCDSLHHKQNADAQVERAILAGQCPGIRLQSLQCSGVTDEANVSPQSSEAVHDQIQGEQSACCLQEDAGADSLIPSVLDNVDVAEQSRILCTIQQQQMSAKHCLTRKKRQMTLGAFVAPKRVK